MDVSATNTLPPGPQLYPIEELLELDSLALAECIQSNCEIIVDGAMSEWGSKVEVFFQKLEKSVLQWHKEGTTQKITVVFSEQSNQGTIPS